MDTVDKIMCFVGFSVGVMLLSFSALIATCIYVEVGNNGVHKVSLEQKVYRG